MEDLGSVFITGGCGLLGYHIVKYLLESGEATQITVFDISTTHNRISHPKITYITGSLTSPTSLLTALQTASANIIINTASPDPLHPIPKLLEDVNIHGTQNVINCAIKLGIKILVHTSSSEVVQTAYNDMHFISETAPLAQNPVCGSVYARTKQIGESLVLKANGKNGLHTVAFRLVSIFGEADQVLTKQSMKLALNGTAKYHIGSGKNLYDFVYGGNAAEAHILAAKKLLQESQSRTPVPENRRVSGEAFFITNDEPWPFWDYATFVAKEMGKEVKEKEIWRIPLWVAWVVVGIVEWVTWIGTAGGRPAITRNMIRYTAQVRTFDIGKARERLEYRARVGMEEGIRRGVRWHLENTEEFKKGV